MEEGVTIEVRVQPRAKRTALLGLHDGAFKIALNAPPVDGEANDELIAFLARAFGVPKKSVSIVRGATSKQKLVRIVGIVQADVARVLVVA